MKLLHVNIIVKVTEAENVLCVEVIEQFSFFGVRSKLLFVKVIGFG